ncbi:hypothetical protein HPB47_022233 [Ixodes persulcatus]|uniref:Uncharacterized protein n=1 Tax=Ixodes persulcatus TaxID=34615 RepID=A0AC60QA72_IXOPE|nr:hypothetical protein HPB47_022233 [Ixodes persulcatus]
MAAGVKLPALIVLKEPTGRISPRALFALKIPGWIRRVWGPNVDDMRRLLVLNQAPIHKTEDVALISGGFTSILHPANVSWMQPLKEVLRGRWAVFFQTGKLTPKGNPKRPSRQNVVDFVAEAWASLSEDMVRRSFKRCGISTSLDAMEDGELNDRLASVNDAVEVGPGKHESLVDEALDLIFDSGKPGGNSSTEASRPTVPATVSVPLLWFFVRPREGERRAGVANTLS